MTPEERLDELEAENTRLLALAERQAEDNRRLLALAERQIAALEVMAGIEPVEAEEPAGSPRPCRFALPPHRLRTVWAGEDR